MDNLLIVAEFGEYSRYMSPILFDKETWMDNFHHSIGIDDDLK